MRIGLVSTASLNHTVAFARVKTQTDATALCRGDSRSRLQRKVSSVCGCHGLVPWRLTLAATKKGQHVADAAALCRGDSRLLLKLRR